MDARARLDRGLMTHGRTYFHKENLKLFLWRDRQHTDDLLTRTSVDGVYIAVVKIDIATDSELFTAKFMRISREECTHRFTRAMLSFGESRNRNCSELC